MQLEQKVFYRFIKVINNFTIFFIIAGALWFMMIEKDSESIIDSLCIAIILLFFVNILKQSILYIAYGKKISFNFLNPNRFINHTEQLHPQKGPLLSAIKKYLSGEFGLCKTYWGSKIFIIIFFVSGATWYNKLLLETQIKYYFVLTTIALTIMISAYIAIYKAAMKYKGKKIWRVLAVLSLVGGITQIFL